jgi:hypothetical protein
MTPYRAENQNCGKQREKTDESPAGNHITSVNKSSSARRDKLLQVER